MATVFEFQGKNYICEHLSSLKIRSNRLIALAQSVVLPDSVWVNINQHQYLSTYQAWQLSLLKPVAIDWKYQFATSHLTIHDDLDYMLFLQQFKFESLLESDSDIQLVTKLNNQRRHLDLSISVEQLPSQPVPGPVAYQHLAPQTPVTTLHPNWKKLLTEHLCGIFDETFPAAGVCIAGGSIVRCLMGNITASSDIDLFIYGPTNESKLETFNAVITWFQQKYANDLFLVVKSSVTYVFIRNIQKMIQVISNNHKTPYEIVDDFDLSSSAWYLDMCDLYSLNVKTTPLGAKSIITRVTYPMNATRLNNKRIIKAQLTGFGLTTEPWPIKLDQSLIEEVKVETAARFFPVGNDDYYNKAMIQALVNAPVAPAETIRSNFVISGNFNADYNSLEFNNFPATVRLYKNQLYTVDGALLKLKVKATFDAVFVTEKQQFLVVTIPPEFNEFLERTLKPLYNRLKKTTLNQTFNHKLQIPFANNLRNRQNISVDAQALAPQTTLNMTLFVNFKQQIEFYCFACIV